MAGENTAVIVGASDADASPELGQALLRIRERLSPVLAELGHAEGWGPLLDGLLSALVGLSVEAIGAEETERVLRRTIELLPEYLALRALGAMPMAGRA